MPIEGHIDASRSMWPAGPATVEIVVNGTVVAVREPTLHRPDVAALLGLDHDLIGFGHQMARSLGIDDTIEVRSAATGHPLANSPSSQHDLRRRQLAYGLPRDKVGLELGALDRPFFSPASGNVVFCDHAGTDALLEKYGSDGVPGTFDPGGLVDVGLIWAPGTTLRDCAGDRLFAFAVGSHVIEHVADPVGWLNDIASCLTDGGRINLAIPDRNLSFDRFRRLTTAAELIEDHHRRLSRPSFRQVFDHACLAGYAEPPRSAEHFRQAREAALLAESGRYIDVHCHVWTKDSFLETWDVVNRLDLSPLRVDRCWDPVDKSNEFIVSLVA